MKKETFPLSHQSLVDLYKLRVLGAMNLQETYDLMHKRVENMCYNGHSTLLVPRTRLWQLSGSTQDFVQTVAIWLLTLEKRGCASLVKAGASGVAQAFILSLLAAK